MNQEPITHKFICVLNKKVEIGRAFNALGHMSVGLSALFNNEDKDVLRFQDYFDADGNNHRSISDNPFIVLKADNSNQIRNLRVKLEALGVKYTDFINTMTVGTYLEQHEKTKETKELDLEYYGICFFMDASEARDLTKKFSLYF